MTHNEPIDPPEILIVDKDNLNIEIINDHFSKHENIVNFELTSTVPDLLSKLEQKKWHLIFLVTDNISISIDALIDAMPTINKQCPIISLSQTYDREFALLQLQAGARNVFSLNEIEQLTCFTTEVLTEQKKNLAGEQHQQLESEYHQRFNTLFLHSPIATAYIHEGAFINTNPAFQTFFNIKDNNEISEISFLDLIDNDDIKTAKEALQKTSRTNSSTSVILAVKRTANDTSSVNLLITPVTINNEASLQVIFQPNKWGIKQTQAPVNDQQLLTPDIFTQALNQVIRNNANNIKGKSHCLSFFEVDGYSKIKSNIGITRSDNLLHEISRFLTEEISEHLKISRLNSDVYTLLFSADSASDCIKAIKGLQNAFSSHTFKTIDKNISVACNIGAVHITHMIHSPDQALSLADVACTVSRNRKKNHIHVYNPEEDRSTVEAVDQNWVDKINDALKNNNFKLLYQPIVSLGAEKEKLFEVLLRIKSSIDDDILPSQFLHFAHQSKLEENIDKWVVKQAVKTIEKNSGEPLRLFINLSETSIKDINFIEWLKDNYDSQVINLVFEIPEDIAIKWQPETMLFTQQIKQLNGTVCIDQFGNHPEDIDKIEELEADYHKIDGGFISNLSTNRKHQSIIHNICSNKNASTHIIANYVQDADSLAILWREGIDFIQGNYLQPPAAHLNYKFESQI